MADESFLITGLAGLFCTYNIHLCLVDSLYGNPFTEEALSDAWRVTAILEW